MSNLFSQLVNAQLISAWADTLDWLFDDARFSKEKGWDRVNVGAYTKAIKRLPNLSKSNYHYGCFQDEEFPNINANNMTLDVPTIFMKKGESEGRDIVRHIRNGIAHGGTRVYHANKELYIEIIDYGKKRKQTAYMAIPISYITELYRIYFVQEKVIRQKQRKGQGRK